MLIHRIFQRPQIKPRPGGATGLQLGSPSRCYRSRTVFRCLRVWYRPSKCRKWRTLNVDLYIPALPSIPAIATALAEVGKGTLETGTANTESDATSQSTSVTSTLGQTTSSTVVEFNLNPTDGGAVVTISSTLSSEGALAGSPVQAADATAGQGRIAQLLQNHPLIESAVTARNRQLLGSGDRLDVQGLDPGGPLDPELLMQVGPLVGLAPVAVGCAAERP